MYYSPRFVGIHFKCAMQCSMFARISGIVWHPEEGRHMILLDNSQVEIKVEAHSHKLEARHIPQKSLTSWEGPLPACPFFTAPPVFCPGAAAPAAGERACWRGGSRCCFPLHWCTRTAPAFVGTLAAVGACAAGTADQQRQAADGVGGGAGNADNDDDGRGNDEAGLAAAAAAAAAAQAIKTTWGTTRSRYILLPGFQSDINPSLASFHIIRDPENWFQFLMLVGLMASTGFCLWSAAASSMLSCTIRGCGYGYGYGHGWLSTGYTGVTK
eukprot:1146256-Pelagomonas_calceolata.AAC.1